MVPVSSIDADGYQRAFDDAVSQTVIVALAEGWDWDAYDPIKLFRRPDSVMEVMDGQVRVAGAVLAGVTHLPAFVLTDLKYAEATKRAGLFLVTNRNRRMLSRYADWHAAVAAGEQWAIDLDRVTKAHGLAVGGRCSANVVAAGEMTRIIRRQGATLLDETLRTLVEAWPDPSIVGRTHGRLILGLAHFISDAQTYGVWDRKKFAHQLGRLDPVADIHREARRVAASLGTSDRRTMAWAVAMRNRTRGWRTLVIHP
jgi:hypothetical protein